MICGGVEVGRVLGTRRGARKGGLVGVSVEIVSGKGGGIGGEEGKRKREGWRV